MTPQEPTVYIIDDEDAIRDSLALLMELAGYHCECHGSADSFLSAVRPEATGCVVADVCMPGTSGIEMLKAMPARDIALPVIVVTGHGDIPMAVAALKLGAVDFIEKPFDHGRLMASIRDALDLAHKQYGNRQWLAALRMRFEQLTARERDVMRMVVAGHSNKAIGGELDISPRTVEIHRGRAMDKMGARSLSELVRMVVRLGEVPDDGLPA